MNSPDVALMDAPDGSPDSENDNDCAGTSESVATAVNDNGVSSSTDWFPIGLSTGETLTSFTVMVIVSLSDSVPSDATMVTVVVL